MKNFAKMVAIMAMAAGTLVMTGCNKVEPPPMDRIEAQYKAMLVERFRDKGTLKLENLKVSNVNCTNEETKTVCKLDATGTLHTSNFLTGATSTINLDDKMFEVRLTRLDVLKNKLKHD